MPVAMVALLILVVAASIYGYVARSNHLLHKWARDNDLEVLQAEFRMVRKGPYTWSSRGQAVFRVEVRDRDGRTRQGWVRCGSWFLGVTSDQVESSFDP